MFRPIYTISLLLVLCSFLPGISGICSETEFTCAIYSESSSCTINAGNATRASYLINQCTLELAQMGIFDTTFDVNLQENLGTITLDIAENITLFNFRVSGINSVNFINTHRQIGRLYLYGSDRINYPFDFLNYFPSLTYLLVRNAGFDRFPYFNTTGITNLNLYSLILPNIVTIQPSMLILPNLYQITWEQSEDAQWFNLIPSSFDNAPLSIVNLNGLQHLYSYQFANIPSMNQLYLLNTFTNFTFEDNALAGLDTITYLEIRQIQTNLDFITKETFPSLRLIDIHSTSITTLDQAFFERQKEIETVYASGNQFHCGCGMAWVSYVTTNLTWTVSGTCNTPASLNGNFISDSSNYINCPNNQSYHCFNDSFICPNIISCVNTVHSAYCECGEGYTTHAPPNACQDVDECSTTNKCEHNCINTIGSHTCSCMYGYTLQSNLFSCLESGADQLTAQAIVAILSLMLQIVLL